MTDTRLLRGGPFAIAVIAAACGGSEPELHVLLDPPREVSAMRPEDLRVQVTGDATYPVHIEMRVSRCPSDVVCRTQDESFPVSEEWHVMEEAVACAEPSETAYVYEVSVFDDEGLTTQPAYFSFMCIP